MPPKQVKIDGASGGKKRSVITIEKKKEIIAKFESGVCVVQLMKEFQMPRSTITTMIKNKEMIKGANVAKGVAHLTPQRSQVLEQVEKLLLVWLNDIQHKGDSVAEEMICARAKDLYDKIQVDTPSTSSETPPEFMASRGWFAGFRRRSGIHNVTRHGDAASSNKEAADAFVAEFASLIRSEGYLPQQIFNCDETGLFWKKMPNRTYITAEEKALPGHKPMKDRLTVLLCANASGDCKVKPLVVYHSENPRVFKRNNVQKGKLPVMWRSNSKAWATRSVCREWITECFGPQVKQFLLDNGLPLKCLLLMDNAPAHPVGLEDELDEELNFITFKFLPPNTTALIQPMDQQVIANFKKLYTRELFARCFQATTDTDLTLREFWKSHFNILHCVTLLHKSWQQVNIRTLQAAWRNLWPSLARDRDFEGFDPADPSVVEDIVSMGTSLGLDIDNKDVEELVEGHREDLTTAELLELHREQLETVEQELTDKEDPVEQLNMEKIKEMCRKWSEVQEFLEQHHPDKIVTASGVSFLNEKVVSHFRTILHKRKRQLSLDRFLLPTSARQEEGESSQKRLTSGFLISY